MLISQNNTQVHGPHSLECLRYSKNKQENSRFHISVEYKHWIQITWKSLLAAQWELFLFVESEHPLEILKLGLN